MTRQKNKLGQTEIIGLAFVVIIAIFGLVLYVSLTSGVESTNTLRQKQLSASMLTTMIQVDIGNIKYQDLVANCVARRQGCDELEDYSSEMLKILEQLNQPYEFTISHSEEEEPVVNLPAQNSEYRCGIIKKAVATQPISLYGTNERAMITLALCN